MEVVKFDRVQDLIINIRNEQVILDSDLAVLYGVEARDINKAVKKTDKFPHGYVLELKRSEKQNWWKFSTGSNPLGITT